MDLIFWQKFWKLVGCYKKELYSLVFFVIVSEMIQLGSPYIFKKIIDTIVIFGITKINILFFWAGVMFFVNELESFIGIGNDQKALRILTKLEKDLPIAAQKKMVYLSLGYHEKENTGAKISKIQRGVDKLVTLTADLFWQVLPTFLQIILTGFVLAFINWRLALIFVFFVPIFVYLTLKLNKEIFPWRKKRHDDYEASSSLMSQSIININSVKSFVQEGREVKDFSLMREEIQGNALKEWYVLSRYNLGRNFVIDLGRISVLFLGVYFVSGNLLTVGSLVFAVTITEKALISLYRISRLYDRIMESSEAVNRLDDLLNEKTTVVNKGNGLKPKNIKGVVEFSEVGFKYGESEMKALDNASFKINSGCVTALVGPSGGGKSTVVKLVYRHYDPTKGRIFLDGKDLREYDIYSFRRFMAIVPQEVDIFDTTIKKNIAYARPNASEKEIRAAARIANAEEFIIRFKDGYETMVGERGLKLSGGQRQRIGIARAVLANPRILIFDEATSSLDSQSEKLIQEAMEKIRKDRTVIIIAHRLSTIKKADKIIVLENGRIVEEGSHFELAKTDGGLYAKLLKLQELGELEGS